MKVSGYTHSTYDLPDNGSRAKNTPSLNLDFSNMTPQEMESARRELASEGKISFHQNTEMALMDGYAFIGVNGGKQVAGSTNMYSMIDSLINYQEKYGVINVKDNIESLKSLRETLEENDVNTIKNTQTINGTLSNNSSNSVDFTNMSLNQLRNWVNDQVKSGNMPFDQGDNLAMMSGHVPVSGNSLIDSTDDEPVNFIEIAQNGIAGAISRHDKNSVKMLEEALTTMNKYQNSSTDFTT